MTTQPGLESECEKFLQECLTPDNCGELLARARAINSRLSAHILNYLVLNYDLIASEFPAVLEDLRRPDERVDPGPPTGPNVRHGTLPISTDFRSASSLIESAPALFPRLNLPGLVFNGGQFVLSSERWQFERQQMSGGQSWQLAA